MKCRGSAVTITGWSIVLRDGTYSRAQGGSNGFGWAKAYYYHNLWTQPIIDTVAQGSISGQPNAKNYTVVFLAGGVPGERVVVVADTSDTYWGGQYTMDGREVGVLTGFYEDKNGTEQTLCPDWVDQTL